MDLHKASLIAVIAVPIIALITLIINIIMRYSKRYELESPDHKQVITPKPSDSNTYFKHLKKPEEYFKWLKENCAYMDIDNLQARAEVIQVKLPEIYIPLYTHKPGKKSGDKHTIEEKDRF